MAEQRDPTKWLALTIAAISLLLSGTSAYFQFVPRHDFRAYVSDAKFHPTGASLSILLMNAGNQTEALSAVFLIGQDGCVWAKGPPNVLKPGEAAIEKIDLFAPHNGFEPRMRDDLGRVAMNAKFVIIDTSSHAKFDFVASYLSDVLFLIVDKHGFPIRSNFSGTTSEWQNLYDANAAPHNIECSAPPESQAR